MRRESARLGRGALSAGRGQRRRQDKRNRSAPQGGTEELMLACGIQCSEQVIGGHKRRDVVCAPCAVTESFFFGIECAGIEPTSSSLTAGSGGVFSFLTDAVAVAYPARKEAHTYMKPLGAFLWRLCWACACPATNDAHTYITTIREFLWSCICLQARPSFRRALNGIYRLDFR